MNQEVVNEQSFRERECIHRALEVKGQLYEGIDYIKHLQALKGDKAIRFASRVSPFFWADAKDTYVWLCDECASELGLLE
jgi:hypothetical protein